ncbi:M56 family metallopeptidase [Lutibacter holmesii]|uniref:M56 family metallopeptidase n=1 Tax=Lutibacter holmesii TaxID=1137985 RepID=A0ABW3WQ02_9FLAO
MINYILQVLLFQALFLAVYDFFLQKETFFKLNRIYLLASPLLSFLIPFLKLESMQQTIPQEYIVQLPTVFLNPQAVLENTTANTTLSDYLPSIFYAGVLIFTMLFLVRLAQILLLIKKNTIVKKKNYNLVILATKQAAFSFFNYVFISNRLQTKKELNIIQHELIHCKQKHSIDLLVFEVLKIILWFNPLIYVYQKRITLLHEYIADAEVVKVTDKNTYFNNLLSETFNVEHISFINQFYKQSFIKKRIAMITKNKSEKMKQFKYLLIVPLLFGMLIYSSCSENANNEISEINSIIENEEVSINGKYFTAKNGTIIFIGTSLDGEVISYENMTEKEKRISDNFSSKESEGIDYSLILEPNGTRAHFIKTPIPPIQKTTVEVDRSVSFATIEDVPVYPGCEGTNEELRLCLQENITKHVGANFNSDLANSLGLDAGTKRIFVMFKIDEEGKIAEVKARAPHKALVEEAKRVINSLPKMIPGKMEGKPVAVKYSLPIAFKVNGNGKKTATKLPEDLIYLLDGKEITKKEMQKIKPDDIESINVLKGENALEKYGKKGENGVIEITLKKL